MTVVTSSSMNPVFGFSFSKKLTFQLILQSSMDFAPMYWNWKGRNLAQDVTMTHLLE